MASVFSLAAAQSVPLRGDVAANVEAHLRLARLAAEAGAGVVVFPELSLTGYELDLAERLAFEEDDARLAPLREAAAALSATLVVGAPVRLAGRLRIGAFILGPGRAIDLYTKHHLGAFSDAARVDGVVPPAEATCFHAGDRDPLVRLGDRTAAVAICADAGRPAHARAAADRGASAYLASMFVIPSDLEGETARLETYAKRHRMAVVFANYGGPSGGLAAAGRSAIWSGTGEVVVRLPAAGVGVAVASVDASGRWQGREMKP